MASEIKVDTVSEKTSGSGVTIDGLLIKDGGISGDVSLIGTTPTFTIGDAGAEDASLVFDGNAQDCYIGLDDSADDLIIGKGSALGTTPIISMTDGGDTTITSTTSSAATGNLTIKSTGNANPAYSNIKLATAGNTTGVMIRGVQASGGNDGRLEFLTNNSGTLGVAMKMDFAGHVTKPLQPAVLYSGNNEANFTGDGTQLRIGIDSGVGVTERFDVNADQATGTFTAPLTGTVDINPFVFPLKLTLGVSIVAQESHPFPIS